MTLVRTSVLNGIATVVRILTSIGLNKVLAVYVGPGGYALVGQFANVVAIVGALAGGAIGNGVTKYTAQHHEDAERQREKWRAAARYSLVASVGTMLLVAVLSGWLAETLLGDAALRPVFLLLACVVPLLAVNALLLAILSGRKEVRTYVQQNIAASLLNAALAAALASRFGLVGALCALAVNQAVVVVVTLWLCRRLGWFRRDAFLGTVRPGTLGPLVGFALMTLTSSLVAPLSQMAVREHLLESFGNVPAGEWQAIYKVSEIYLTLFTTTLSLYYLPRLAELRGGAETWAEIRKVYAFVLPVAAVAAVLMFGMRTHIVTMLFTRDFLGMVDLFAWQLVGDVLKIGSWILGFVMVGRAMVRWFIASEVVFGTSWVLLTLALTPSLGVNGASAAFAANYALYWIFLAWLVTWKLRETSA